MPVSHAATNIASLWNQTDREEFGTADGNSLTHLGLRSRCDPDRDRTSMIRHALAAATGLLCLFSAAGASAEDLPSTMDRYDCSGAYVQTPERAGARTQRFHFGLLWNTDTGSMAFIGSVPILDSASLILSGQFASTVAPDGTVHFATNGLGPQKTQGDVVLDTAARTLRLAMTWSRADQTPAGLTLEGVCVQNRTYSNLQPLQDSR
jgi:hypothetical protein